MIDAEKLRAVLDYDPETGEFRWRVRMSNRVLLGSIAGTLNRQHVRIDIGGRRHYAHRLAWLHVTGEWPSMQIDHINGNGSDNRFANLRLATHGQNRQNSRLSCNNTTGVKGVSEYRGKWKAQIDAEGQRVHLGLFDSFEAAAAARQAAEINRHGQFRRAA